MDIHVSAKKSLGQNFLKDKKTLEIILKSVAPGITVFEIGPGKGALTQKLLDAGHQVIAIEKDDRLIGPLQEEFKDYLDSGQLRLIHGDALVDTPEAILGNSNNPYQVVANLPYYITGLYIRRTLESDYQPTQVILLLQEEVVDRIVAVEGKESILSISVKVYGTVRKLCRVARKHFSPAPRVDSAVLMIGDISKCNFVDHALNEQEFFAVLKQGFASKRKTLANNLKQYKGAKELIAQIGVDEKIRPERLTVEQWLSLIRSID